MAFFSSSIKLACSFDCFVIDFCAKSVGDGDGIFGGTFTGRHILTGGRTGCGTCIGGGIGGVTGGSIGVEVGSVNGMFFCILAMHSL